MKCIDVPNRSTQWSKKMPYERISISYSMSLYESAIHFIQDSINLSTLRPFMVPETTETFHVPQPVQHPFEPHESFYPPSCSKRLKRSTYLSGYSPPFWKDLMWKPYDDAASSVHPLFFIHEMWTGGLHSEKVFWWWCPKRSLDLLGCLHFIGLLPWLVAPSLGRVLFKVNLRTGSDGTTQAVPLVLFRFRIPEKQDCLIKSIKFKYQVRME